MHAPGRGALVTETNSWSSLCARPDWTPAEPAAAVRADIVKYVLDTVRAESAFIGADMRLGRLGWEVLVAVFAVWS